jgi:uncharacterized protein YndB with AHSA1/START domain
MAVTAKAAASADERSIVISRTIAAPRELVFEAWTDPRHLAQWWGPNGFTTTTQSFDMRPGGVWRFVMHGPDGRDYDNRITFDEIAKPERIVYHHGGGGDVEPVQFRTTVTFDAAGGRTKLTLRMVFPTAEERDRVVREYGAEEGGHQTVARLADYVARMAAPGAGAAGVPFTITRALDAPRPLVWQAWTEPDRLKRWWGPKGFIVRHCTLDLRPGGVFHYGLVTPNGQEMWGKFVYREIVAPERLVFVSSFSDGDGKTMRSPFSESWPLEVLASLTFSEDRGRTMLALHSVPVNATQAEQDTFAVWHGSMQQGWTGTLDQLAGHLSES